MEFEATTQSLSEIFGNQKKGLYKIPRYQRPYRWNTEQVEQLWEDLFEGYKNNESSYFLGSIVTAKTDNNKVDVIDGQQRLTTLMILFCVIRNLYPNINENSLDENSIDIDTLENFIYFKKKFERLTLMTDEKHRNDFENIILKGNIKEILKQTKQNLNNDEKPEYKFKNTAFIFKEKLQDLSFEDIEKFINYIANNVYLIRIDCENTSFAIKLFQVINDRGLDLNSSDLIKSHLIEKIVIKYKEDNDIMKEKENEFISKWRDIETIISNTDISMNDLFILYEYYILGENPKKSLDEELKDNLKNDSIDIIEEIKQISLLYRDEIYFNNDKIISSLKYLRWKFYWKAILLTALYKKYNNYEKLKNELKRFYYLYWIGGYTLTKIKQISFKVIKYIKENQDFDFIKKKLNEKLKNDNVLERVKNNLFDENIYKDSWTKPLLLSIEYNLNDANESFIKLDKDLHLEHILPKEYKNNNYWKFITNQEKEYLNKLANFTLLKYTKNISASNLGFNEKKEIYLNGKEKKITSFEITKQITKYEKWDINNIKNREKWIITQINKLLDINLEI